MPFDDSVVQPVAHPCRKMDALMGVSAAPTPAATRGSCGSVGLARALGSPATVAAVVEAEGTISIGSCRSGGTG